GVEAQRARREVYSLEEPITVSSGNATLTLHPPQDTDAPGLKLTYFLDYGPRAPLARQTYTCELTPTTFIRHVAAARTFLLEAEALAMRGRGLGLKMTASDVLVFGRSGLIDNRLRHADEPARHKVLDVIGDLSLLGVDLYGHVVACRSGHPLNVEMAK